MPAAAHDPLMPVHHAGIGSVQKAIVLLRIVAAQGPQRLSQLSETSGLNKVTALRILGVLVQEGMLRRLEDGAGWRMGCTMTLGRRRW
jgi:DNA-binding IclR family transcriptional regulator